jgi:hypothetical protein
MFTTLYSVKVLYLTFLTNPNGPLINYKQAHEGDIYMSLPLMILAVFSIFFGFITKDMFIGLGSGFFSDNALFIHPSHEIMLDTEFGVPTLFKLLPLIFTISLSVIAIVLSEYLSTILIYFKLSRLGYNIFSFFNQRFLIELFYNKYITGVVLKLGGQTTKVIDKGSVEYLGPHGLEKGLWNISNNIAKLNTGVITSYALYILIGLILYLLFNSYNNSFIIILALLISLPLVLFQPYTSNKLTLESASPLLHQLIQTLSTHVGAIPGVSAFRRQGNHDFATISRQTNQRMENLRTLRDNVINQGQTELSNPNIRPEEASEIQSIIGDADTVFNTGVGVIAEAMKLIIENGVAPF